MVYLSCMIAFAKFSGEIWDKMYSATSLSTSTDTEAITVLDARIKHWEETTLPSIPLRADSAQPRYYWQSLLVSTVSRTLACDLSEVEC